MSKKLFVADLCSGNGGFSEGFRLAGHNVIRYEIDPQFQDVPNTVNIDVWSLSAKQLDASYFDVILASPPCEWGCVPSIGSHWTGGKEAYRPKDAKTLRGWALAQHCLEIVRDSKASVAIMEQPVGVARKVLTEKPTGTVWLCQFGDTRAKPTDIYGRPPSGFQFKKCHNGATDHASAPRGSRTPGSTQGLNGSARRADMSRLGQAVLEAINLTDS